MSLEFGSRQAREQQFQDEMARFDRELEHLAITDHGEGWESGPLRGRRAYVYWPADAPFPTPCTVFEQDTDRVRVCIGDVGDVGSTLVWVDASQVTFRSPQLGLF